ncbi:MAG: nucleotidyltransferase domain-containing protein [Selenomonadaceae bacterium]|nr:nucleotidyltransferase domain-containing protein [Selenomonadaceae bacterium]
MATCDLQRAEYNFLREDPRLGKNIAYLTLAGSISYGTDNEKSDTDIRGFAVESVDDLLTGKAFEQVEDRTTDTVIYGLRKFFHLCTGGNPNVIELLGTKPEHILYMNEAGKKVRDNAEIFLSKRAFKSFAGYATAQLRRLQNALAHDSYPEREKNQHILKSIESMMMPNREDYEAISFKLTDDEILISVDAKELPLRKFLAMNSSLTTMLNNYDKLNHRNRKKDDEHLNKHAMHLVRLYLTGIDILEGRGVITYREKDLPLLRKIRAGEVPFEDIFKMADEFEVQMLSAYKNSKLPDNPDVAKIDKLLLEIYHELRR